MNLRYLFILCIILVLTSCERSLTMGIPYDKECNFNYEKTTEWVSDFKSQFSIALPKNWKINLYYDDIQSSLYAADTTKQLTESILLDISFINQQISLDDLFSLKQEQDHLQKRLIKTNTFYSSSGTKRIHHSIFKGKKDDFIYQKHIIHIKESNENFIIATIELYGDENLDERSCQALQYLESIKLFT